MDLRMILGIGLGIGLLLAITFIAVVVVSITILVKKTKSYTEDSGNEAILAIFRWSMFVSFLVYSGRLAWIFIVLMVVSHVSNSWITDNIRKVDHVRILACAPLMAWVIGMVI